MGTVDPRAVHSRAEFAHALTMVRESAGLSVRDVARLARVEASTVGGYFSGRHLPPPTSRGVLAAVLGACSVNDPAEQEAWIEAARRARRAPRPGSGEAVTGDAAAAVRLADSSDAMVISLREAMLDGGSPHRALAAALVAVSAPGILVVDLDVSALADLEDAARKATTEALDGAVEAGLTVVLRTPSRTDLYGLSGERRSAY